MAHFKRKKPRSAAGGYYSRNGLQLRLGNKIPQSERKPWTGSYPRNWDIVFHTRPARREANGMLNSILRGSDPDNMVWPDGRKPHIYYW